MIRINLLPVKEAQQAEGRRRELSLVGLLAIVLLLAFVGLRIHQRSVLGKLESGMADLETRLETLKEKVGEVASLDEKRKELDDKLEVIAQLQHRRVGPARVLQDLSEATPERLWLTELAEFNGAATLSGRAVDNQTIATFMRDLSTSPFFGDVDLVETTQAVVGDAKLRAFVVKARIDYAATRPKTEGEDAPATDGEVPEGTDENG